MMLTPAQAEAVHDAAELLKGLGLYVTISVHPDVDAKIPPSQKRVVMVTASDPLPSAGLIRSHVTDQFELHHSAARLAEAYDLREEVLL